MPDLRLTREILEVVEQQLRDHNPPETGETFDRLIKAGYRRPTAIAMIGSALMTEVQHMLRENRSFDRQHFGSLLNEMR
ncbi:MAG TPA: hypothetical protein VF818_03750 [Ktedonobacterales bacterium]